MNNVICVTRFSNETFREYRNYMDHEFCSKLTNNPPNVSQVYNTPIEIAKSKKHTNPYYLVMEMNNSENEIMGVSIIKNRVYYKKYHIYREEKLQPL